MISASSELKVYEMSNVMGFLRYLSEKGLENLISKQEGAVDANSYIKDLIEKNPYLIGKVLMLYESASKEVQNSYIWSTMGPYSPSVSDELVELKRIMNISEHFQIKPRLERLSIEKYEKLSSFIDYAVETMKENKVKVTYESFVKLSILLWNSNFPFKGLPIDYEKNILTCYEKLMNLQAKN